MSSVVIAGDTSGSVTLAAPSVAGTTTLTLPATTGTVALTASPIFTGQATIPTISLTGGQIAFPATQSASSDANTLDDYEEGTWTPSVTFGGNSVGVTYNSRVGTYIKIGKTVFFQAYLGLSNKGSSTGAMRFAGLPFTSQTTGDAYTSISFYCGAATGTSGSYMLYIPPGGASTVEVLFSQTGTGASFSNNNCLNASDFIISGTYIATA